MWINKYPRKVWINILTFDSKYLDYKICGEQRDWRTWTMYWNEEILANKDKVEVISNYVKVNNSIERNEAFNYGENLVNKYREANGDYQY